MFNYNQTPINPLMSEIDKIIDLKLNNLLKGGNGMIDLMKVKKAIERQNEFLIENIITKSESGMQLSDKEMDILTKYLESKEGM